MSMTPGLVPNLRQPVPPEEKLFDDGSEIEIINGDDLSDKLNTDHKGNILSIEHPDGAITISLDDSPLGNVEDIGNNSKNRNWFDNLVEDIPEMNRGMIADDIVRAIEQDISSRKEWIEEVSNGLKLLGLKVETPGVQGAADGAPVEGMSRIRHPLMLEAVLRFQANARSELLPVDGPVKIRNDNNNANLKEDQLGNALEKDMNHFLTTTAKEYYPDTDRMLLNLGFAGTSFKKGYMCPLRGRPVLETVEAEDLIVNNSATSLSTATRITHRIRMSKSTVKRMQILGVYLDTDLSTPDQPTTNSVKRAKDNLQGVNPTTTSNPEDRDREIYECYCELDLPGYEHKWKGKETGLAIPYRVTIDVSTKKILSIVRNYDEDDQQLPEAKQHFVQYLFVPGFGFYGIGLLHILGNATQAITAAWRELLDAGMYNNFPGFLIADMGLRQNTNLIRVPPGGAAPIKMGSASRIQDAVMPLPYKEPSQALMALTDNIAQTGMRIGGTSEQQVGEGRADAPVGTTLAMIEQATKVLNAVHKRMHAAQAEEFQLLVRLFKENPESFWQKNRKPAFPWDEKTFQEACDNCNLVPQADPNTASHGQRLMKLMALKQLQAANPSMYDPIAIDQECIKGIGFSNPEQFMAPPSAQGKPPPELQQAMAKIANDGKKADAAMISAQASAKLADAKVQETAQGLGGANAQPNPLQMMEAQAKMMDAQTKAKDLEVRQTESQHDAIVHQQDNEAKQRVEAMRSQHDQRSDDMAMAIEQLAMKREQMKIAADQMQHENKMVQMAAQENIKAKTVKPARTPKATPKKD